MDNHEHPDAPDCGASAGDRLPTLDQLAADPEIAALLDFEPAPRKIERPDGWTPELQRELVARIADMGSPGHACDAMDKNLSGAKHLYRTDGADSFRAAWKAAMALAAERKRAERAARVRHPDDVPGITRGKRAAAMDEAHYLPGIPVDLQDRDYREALDYERRAAARWDESTRRVRDKIFMCRRFYLSTIADDPERRAAWDLLCGPADWDAARDMQAQPDEDRDPVSLDELRTASWQVPLKTGFCPGITEASRSLAANTLERLEQSIRSNDPRWSGRRD